MCQGNGAWTVWKRERVGRTIKREQGAAEKGSGRIFAKMQERRKICAGELGKMHVCIFDNAIRGHSFSRGQERCARERANVCKERKLGGS